MKGEAADVCLWMHRATGLSEKYCSEVEKKARAAAL